MVRHPVEYSIAEQEISALPVGAPSDGDPLLASFGAVLRKTRRTES